MSSSPRPKPARSPARSVVSLALGALALVLVIFAVFLLVIGVSLADRGVAPRLDRLGRRPRRPVLRLGRDGRDPGRRRRVGSAHRPIAGRWPSSSGSSSASSSVSTCSTRPTRPSATRPQLAVDPGVRPLVVGRPPRRLHRPDRRDHRRGPHERVGRRAVRRLGRVDRARRRARGVHRRSRSRRRSGPASGSPSATWPGWR